jgi:hypothetical protein
MNRNSCLRLLLLPTTANVRRVVMSPRLISAVRIIVASIQTQMLLARDRGFWASDDDAIQRGAQQFHVMTKGVSIPPHTPLRIARANKGPLWIRQGATWTKR